MACLSVVGVGRVVRHHLGQPVDQPQRQLHDAADVAQHRTCLQRAEGDDLRDAVAAVLALHVLDDAFAPVLAEVDVEVGHGHPLGVEEALEQEAEAQRIQPRDLQRPRHQRSGAGAAARPHRHPVGLGPLDEVRHDQEVARKPHAGDDARLQFQPGPVVRLGEGEPRPTLGRQCGDPARQALTRLVDQLLGLRAALAGVEARPGWGRACRPSRRSGARCRACCRRPRAGRRRSRASRQPS